MHVRVECGCTCVHTKLTFRLHHTQHSCSSFTALWCGCSFVKLTFYLPHPPSWLWLVSTTVQIMPRFHRIMDTHQVVRTTIRLVWQKCATKLVTAIHECSRCPKWNSYPLQQISYQAGFHQAIMSNATINIHNHVVTYFSVFKLWFTVRASARQLAP